MASAKGDGRWWHRFCREGYVHCWATRRLWSGCWLWLEWNHNGVTHSVVSPAAVSRMVAAAHEVVVLRRPRVNPVEGRGLPLVGVLHCSLLTGHLLGLRGCWTPWRLRREALRAGARAMPRRHEDPKDARPHG